MKNKNIEERYNNVINSFKIRTEENNKQVMPDRIYSFGHISGIADFY